LGRRARKRRAGPAELRSGVRRPATTEGSDRAGTTDGSDRAGSTVGDDPRGMAGGDDRAEPRASMSRGYARSRERDEAARAALVPLAPGERPRAVTIAAVLAAIIAAGNLVLIAAGWEVDGERPVVGGLVFTGVMVAAAVGMWTVRYWAVLGFQVLLGVSLVIALLGLLRASNLAGVLVCFAIIGIAGPLFWFLIRAMARIQMPRRPPRQRPGPPVG
jgi:hypothetical protein